MLRKLKLEKDLKLQRSVLTALEEQETALKTREQELTAALAEAETDEDMQTINDGVEQLEKDIMEAGIEEKKNAITAEIERIEEELAELDTRVQKTKNDTPNKEVERGMQTMGKARMRELLKTGEYYQRSEVRGFYEKVKELRTVAGAELLIPEIVINRIMDIVGDYSTLYHLVDKTTIGGKGRILVDTDTDPATWIEQTGVIPDGDVGTIIQVEFDGFKAGKVVFVDNALLADSLINLDEYVTKKIARALALAIDKAILKGAGAEKKQPEGIIPQLNASHKVEIAADGNMLKNVVRKIGLIDTGEDTAGEIVVVMKRSTYYNRVAEFSVNVDADGNVVGKLPNLRQPDFVGLRIVFNNFMDEDCLLFGDFEKYTLVEREHITLDNSIHVKFQEDQTAFRGKGRFDGKPTKKDAFVLITLTDPAEGAAV